MKYSFVTMLSFRFFAFTLPVFILNVLPAQGNPTAEQNEKIAKRAEEIAPYLSNSPRCVGRSISERPAWQALAALPGFQTVVPHAEELITTPIPELPESLYKEFFENGNRSHFQSARAKKYNRIRILVLAECLENQGRFLKPLEETIRSVCNDPSWVLPAHDFDTIVQDGKRVRVDAAVYDGKTVYVDLVSADTSVELGLAVLWLGEKLSPEIRELILENVRRRTFEPYERSVLSGNLGRNYWITTTNNWKIGRAHV